MAERGRTLKVQVVGDIADIKKDLASVDRSMTGLERSAKSLSQTAKVAGGAIIGAFAVDAIVDFASGVISAAAEEEAGIKKLTVAISENDRAWDGNIAKVEEVIDARERLAFSDGEQRDSLARLVSVTKDLDRALELQRVAMDLARLRGMNLVDAGELIGKVYGGNTGILSRYGIQLRKGATSTEALAEIQKRAAGQAEAYADTTAGAMDTLAIELENLQEDIGKELLPVMKDLAIVARDDIVPAVRDFVDLLKDASQYTDELGTVIGFLTGDIGNNNRAIQDWFAAQDTWVQTFHELGNELGYNRRELLMLAQEFQRSGRTIVEFGAYLGSLREVEAEDILPDPVEFEARADAMPKATKAAVSETKVAIGSLKGAYRQAVRDAETFDKEWRFALANPDKGERTANQIKEQMEKAMRRRNRALREGNREAFAVADREVTRLQNRLNDLEQREYNISVRLAVEGGKRLNAMAGKIAAIEGYKADGGPVGAGKRYIVGERGPEVLTMGSQSGFITPNHALGSGSTVVNVTVNAPVAADGARVGQEIAHYLDQHFARGGRFRYAPVGGNR